MIEITESDVMIVHCDGYECKDTAIVNDELCDTSFYSCPNESCDYHLCLACAEYWCPVCNSCGGGMQ